MLGACRPVIDMAKILLASSLEVRTVFERVLNGHDVHYAQTLAQASRLLEEHCFDEIVCTMLFDDSRMFDLLKLVKSNQKCSEVPVVCTSFRSRFLDHPIVLEGVSVACKRMGAAAFLNIGEYHGNVEQLMRADIDGFLRLNRTPESA